MPVFISYSSGSVLGLLGLCTEYHVRALLFACRSRLALHRQVSSLPTGGTVYIRSHCWIVFLFL